MNRGNFCDADLEPLAALVNLEKLSLGDTNQVTGSFCGSLTGLLRLSELSVSEQVTDEGLVGIAGLSRLTSLFLTGPFTSQGFARLAALQNLETIGARSEHVTAEGIAVVAELPKLNYCDLGFRA